MRTPAALLLAATVLVLATTASAKIVPGYTKCSRVAVGKGAKAKVAVRRVSCAKGHAVARGYYAAVGGTPDGHNADGSIYFAVEGFHCSTGLGGSQGFCSHRDQKVLLSVRTDDAWPY